MSSETIYRCDLCNAVVPSHLAFCSSKFKTDVPISGAETESYNEICHSCQSELASAMWEASERCRGKWRKESTNQGAISEQ